MPGVKVRGFGSVELDKSKVRKLSTNEPIKLADLYRDGSLEIEDEIDN